MNPKIPVLGVIGAFAVVILIIAYSGTSIIDDTSGEARLGTSGMPTLIPLIIELEDIEILNVDERIAFVEISVSYTHLTLPTILLV